MVVIWHLHSMPGHSKKLKLILILKCFFDPFRITKPATNGNHRMAIMSKIETTSKVSLKLHSRINLRRRGVRSEPSTFDTTHKLPTALKGPLERVNL